MMLKTEDIEKIAYLARLEISAEEAPRYVEDLSGIIDFVEQLSACDTANVGPMAHPLDTFQRLRADEV
ncbi:MAG: Asp-tRNA(Asn)/Glu-tRNA(Gln) amidotransferase subunit GatC, partial [Gammaproteobacteria bacterium]|nr:Asp-tRNA(Asn)/Glu-tRNA(Gln) amidotransferase subunit GatC [Gammaproteobacteria bacterium]